METINQVMVPLDGSHASEEALTLAAAIARRSGARIVLAHVREETDTAVALPGDYLAPLLAATMLRGLRVEAKGLRGAVSDTLLTHARESRADLIVMTSRGRGGVQRALCGSVADAVIRRAEIPVLLVKQPPEEPPFRRVLLPLDGTTTAEAIIPFALGVTGTADVNYILLRVHPALTPDGRIEPGPVLGQRSDAVVDSYLSTLAARVSASGGGVAVSWLAVVHAENADTIMRVATRENVDLIAMTTRGSGGADRAVFGSVADVVVRKAASNVLVLRPPAASV